ncbi:hypothetical protein ALC57_11073 [Trachymyrmex cornetzi]|uniref:Helix-turn-helix domain-containing protein n=1 Tax=Trachymyrmex cornetzi TaxID=471704 RepID=A0A195DVH6_9HYME|nr:hypothetical protein ALC57_11073 [Trachymyrmex cornetzi]
MSSLFVTNIPDNVKFILQLGQRFNLKYTIRKDSIPILHKIQYSNPNNLNNNLIKKGIEKFQKFVSNHPDLLITRADKGNTTVLLDLNDYNSKMHEILSDHDTYIIINKNPINKIMTEIRTLLTNWKTKGYISIGYHIRIIVRCINSPFINFATFLKDIIEGSIDNNFGYIKNSFELVKRINGMPIEQDYKIVSFDIRSMYTNIQNDDDIILTTKKDQIETILCTFNSYHERIQFTVEYSDDGGISFLDVKLMIDNEMIIFDNYKKITNSGRYLNFNSNHPIKQKKGVVIEQLDRILFLAHLKFHERNIYSLTNTFLNNGYPLEFLFSTINNRIKAFL